MRIDRLEVRNFRRFRHATLEFPDGVIGLVGRNGAGKSTLIEAIAWAIYGRFASRTRKVEDVRRATAGPADDVSVRLLFRYDGHAYDLVRELKGKSLSPSASLKVDGKILVQPGANSGDQATRYLERLFHMDRDAFFTSLVARQKELDGFSALSPSERKERVIRLLRIDAVDDAIQIARERRRDLRAKTEAVAFTIKDEKELEARRLALAQERALHEAAREEAQTLATAAQSAAARLVAEREALQQRAATHADLVRRQAVERERLASRERDAEEAARQVAAIDALAAEVAALAHAPEALKGIREEAQTLALTVERAREAARLDATLVRLRSQAAEVDARLAERAPARKLAERLRVEIDAQRTALAEAERALAADEADLRRSKVEADASAKRAEGLRALGRETPCPTCTRPLHEHYDGLVGHFDAETAERLSAARAIEARRAANAQRRAGLREALAALLEREAEVRQKVVEAARLEAERASLAERLASETRRAEELRFAAPEDAAASLAALKAREAALSREAERFLAAQAQVGRRAEWQARGEKAGSEAAMSRAELSKLDAALIALAFDPTRFAVVAREADAALRASAAARESAARAEGQVARLQDSERRLLAEIEENASRAKERATLLQDLLYLERVAGERDGGLLAEFKDHLVSRIRPELSEVAGALFRDLTDGRYAGLAIDDDYALRVVEAGVEHPLERYSGGESDLANLCLRLAVGHVIAERSGGADFGFIALDEIFGSQDEGRRQNILRALAGLSGRFRQILVVTHFDDVKESVERVIRVEEAADGTSTATLEG